MIDKSKIDFFLAANSTKFEPYALMSIRETLETMSDDQFMMIQAGDYRDPSTIMLIAIFLGWDRFFLDDIGLGIVKIISCQGFFIWWLIDIFTATERTKKYNYNKLMQLASYMR